VTLTWSLTNSKGHKSKVKLVIQDKIEAYLERKYRVSRSFATRDSYRFAVFRFVDFIQVQYKQDFEQVSVTIKQSDADPISILDEYFTFLADYIKRYKITNHLFLRDDHKSDEEYIKNLVVTRQSFERMLRNVRSNIPELNKKNENGRNAIYFHALRS